MYTTSARTSSTSASRRGMSDFDSRPSNRKMTLIRMNPNAIRNSATSRSTMTRVAFSIAPPLRASSDSAPRPTAITMTMPTMPLRKARATRIVMMDISNPAIANSVASCRVS